MNLKGRTAKRFYPNVLAHFVDLTQRLLHSIVKGSIATDLTSYYTTPGSRSHALPGCKKDKARITVVLCANMDGTEKIIKLVINQHQITRCMKGINRTQLGELYLANKNSEWHFSFF